MEGREKMKRKDKKRPKRVERSVHDQRTINPVGMYAAPLRSLAAAGNEFI